VTAGGTAAGGSAGGSAAGSGAFRAVIQPRRIDFGGFSVHRALPARGLHAVGPWVFFDHMGPTSFPPGKGVDVLPHPHINLATVTYLFEGEIVHRDSIGSVQTITPGAINLMVAARGIVHSERTGPELRAVGHRMNGLQLWFALPEENEQSEPTFTHYPADDLPRATLEAAEVRVIIGHAWGLASPVRTFSPTLYAEARIPAGADLPLPEDAAELGVYPLSGRLRVGGAELAGQSLSILAGGPAAGPALLSAVEDSRIALIGGTPLGRRYMWWNFVSSRMERIERARADWNADRLGHVPGETERYPLPEHDRFSESEGQSSR
jgi:redox-sensitive bicupin YhaK (pirin superfamily)